MKKLLPIVAILVVLIGSVFSAITYFASLDYVKASDKGLLQKIEMVSNAFNLAEMNRTIMQIQSRMWQYEDKNGGDNWAIWVNQKDKGYYRKLKMQLERLKKQYDELLKKGSK